MSAQYVRSAGPGERHFVNQDFAEAVGDLYPVTWEKIPLGWHVYTGWQGKDEVLFTTHGPVGEMEGQTYEVSFPPDRPEAFFGDILPHIQHTKMAHEVQTMTRQRITWDKDALTKKWGMTLDDTMALRQKQAARVPSGMYGYTKVVQASCEAASRKLEKQAATLIKQAAQKDPRVLAFLGVHSKRAKSLSARILLESYKDSIPKVATDKEATHYGMYGYPVKTARLGVSMCAQMREAAGIVAAELHRRQATLYAKITGFLGEHGKMAKSGTARLILSVYPDEGFSFGKRASEAPQTVDDWLAWEPDAS